MVAGKGLARRDCGKDIDAVAQSGRHAAEQLRQMRLACHPATHSAPLTLPRAAHADVVYCCCIAGMFSINTQIEEDPIQVPSDKGPRQ